MTKNSKNQCMVSVEDSFVSSDCSVFEISIKKWYDAEFERLAAKGKDASKFHLLADPDINVGSVCCEDYSIRFNRDEAIIDLVVNGEKDSPIWNDVMGNVPPVFASYLGDPESFLYRISTYLGAPEKFIYDLSPNTSEKKWYYGFSGNSYEGGTLFLVNESHPIVEWKAESFDTML